MYMIIKDVDLKNKGFKWASFFTGKDSERIAKHTAIQKTDETRVTYKVFKITLIGSTNPSASTWTEEEV